MHDIDIGTLRAEMARREIPQWKAAASIGASPAALSHWLNGRLEAPASLRPRLERLLGLPEGALKRLSI